MYYRLLENKAWAKDAQNLKNRLKLFVTENEKLIDYNEDWEFNMVYGILYSQPIRAIFRLKRYMKHKLKRTK